jgi:hypothetical protein
MKEQLQLDGLLFTSDTEVLCVMNQILESFAIATEVCSELDPALDARQWRLAATKSQSGNRRMPVLENPPNGMDAEQQTPRKGMTQGKSYLW